MNGPVRLDPAGVCGFVARDGFVVLFLSVHPVHRFSRSLCERFVAAAGNEVAFGQLSLPALFRAAGDALAFVHEQTHALGGAFAHVTVLPGYYLFCRGRMLAWHSGLPEVDDAKPIARASMLGAVFSALSRDPRFIGLALLSAAEEAAAARIAADFHRAAAGYQDDPRQASQWGADAAADELARAYRVLGIEPTATDEELLRAWRSLQRKFHPDRARDPEAFDRSSRVCVEINRARDVIREHRRNARGQGTRR